MTETLMNKGKTQCTIALGESPAYGFTGMRGAPEIRASVETIHQTDFQYIEYKIPIERSFSCFARPESKKAPIRDTRP
ncbi:hypothetical protein [Pandoraea fibrosis]|uniref:Uncharacterized protein n=1 Tax=Pandoraea fibrosis TaxID=1891094 RepID=A0A5E4YT21_9BURK|nr:hypothetical protein [Pandoraea fibrosis]VVE51946.1 hypothetical protein PFI31113_04726 [Pandoraea fibrosis]